MISTILYQSNARHAPCDHQVEAVDGLFLAAFQRPAEALLWALECNEHMIQEEWPHELLVGVLWVLVCSWVSCGVFFGGWGRAAAFVVLAGVHWA